MTTLDLVTTSYYVTEHLPRIRSTLLDVYSDVHAEEIATDPFFSMERFEERLDRHSSVPGWGCVIADVDADVVGFGYGRPDRDRNAFGLCELMLRQHWRGRNLSRVLHDELMSHRNEQRVSLLVRRQRPRVRALYERWGYRHVGEELPSPDAPLYDRMVLGLR